MRGIHVGLSRAEMMFVMESFCKSSVERKEILAVAVGESAAATLEYASNMTNQKTNKSDVRTR
jgi:hypothetical protein